MGIDLDTCRDPDMLAAEVRRLREAIRRLADQDATLSVCEGNVTVTMDATLTDAEREAIERAIRDAEAFGNPNSALVPLDLLRGLLERTRATDGT